MTDVQNESGSRIESRPWVRADRRASRPLRLAPAQRGQLARWIERAYPYEACGLLVGRATDEALEVIRVAEATNLEADRAWDRFTLDPADWLAVEDAARADGLEIVGIWHSHPDHPAQPSRTDLASAWEGYAYLIVRAEAERAPEWRAWQLEGGVFVEQTLEH